MSSGLDFFHRPRSVAVVGASDDPEKIGGRPLRYMQAFGYRGLVIPVNPRRHEVQGMATVPSLEAAPAVPDVALIAVPGQAAVSAVSTAARLGVKGCIVMSSGFGETSSALGRDQQGEMLREARQAGMRIVGPNSQGLASFDSGAVLGFSTLFTEDPPLDGPVGIVSQSGAMCSVTYGILRRQGIGVRYAHGSGNDADVTASELAAAVVDDDEVKLVLLYLETVADPEAMVELAERSTRRNVPVVALVGGRSLGGSRAAASHTGALATERRVLDAFLERIGIWQVHSVRDLVASTRLYLQDWAPMGSGLAVVSNSGAVCVLAADAADDVGLPLAELAPATTAALAEQLPTFATTTNPVDVTAALLTDSSIFGRVLTVLASDPAIDACLLGIPVAGRGYDVGQFARDASRFAASGTPLVLAIPQPSVAAPFLEAGLVVFEEEATAVAALGQYLSHRQRMRRAVGLPRPALGHRSGSIRMLNESESLLALAGIGIPVVDHELVATPLEAGEAFARAASERVVVKGCTRESGHKSELGLVVLGSPTVEATRLAAEQIAASAADHGVSLEGFLVAPLVRGVREVLVGAHVNAVFGPVMVVGSGGLYVEAMPDSQVLMAPCTEVEVRTAIQRLRIWPLLAGVRGEPAADVDAWVTAVVAASTVLADPACPVRGFDVNPLMLMPAGEGAQAVDAVVLSVG